MTFLSPLLLSLLSSSTSSIRRSTRSSCVIVVLVGFFVVSQNTAKFTAITIADAFPVRPVGTSCSRQKSLSPNHIPFLNKQRQQLSAATNDDDTGSTTTADLGYTLIQKDRYDIVEVDLEERSYPIYIGTGYEDDETAILLLQHVKGKKILFITNDRIAPLGYMDYYTKIIQQRDPSKQIHQLIIPDGEENKNMDILNTILDKCLQVQLDRKATLVAVGGGVIGDMVGFAAAIYVRGIRFLQIPTTVMSMVDSSVGGKTGVNHALGKNMIGAFHQPSCVLIDTATLRTLPDRELSSGISEIIKYGLIRDYEFFVWLEQNMEQLVQRNPTAIRYAVTRSCQNKAAVVKADEMEANDIRATLNLGHTFGHAIENGCGYGTYLHGEAVAIGIVMATELSYRLGWIQSNDVTRIVTLVQRANLPTSLEPNTPMTRELFLSLMAVDKKVTDNIIRLILLQGPLGNCIVTGDYDRTIMIQVIDDFITAAQEGRQVVSAGATNTTAAAASAVV